MVWVLGGLGEWAWLENGNGRVSNAFSTGSMHPSCSNHSGFAVCTRAIGIVAALDFQLESTERFGPGKPCRTYLAKAWGPLHGAPDDAEFSKIIKPCLPAPCHSTPTPRTRSCVGSEGGPSQLPFFRAWHVSTSWQAWCEHHQVPMEDAAFLLGKVALKPEEISEAFAQSGRSYLFICFESCRTHCMASAAVTARRWS